MRTLEAILSIGLVACCGAGCAALEVDEEQAELIGIDPTLLCKAVVPTISNITVTALPGGDRLVRDTIFYVAGDGVELALTIPACSGLTEVRWNGTALGTSSGDIEPVSAYYTLLGEDVLDGNLRRVRLRLHFTNLGRGNTNTLQLTVRAVIGTAATTAQRTVVEVADAGSPVTYSMSEAELSNRFIESIYDRFGDDGRDEDEETGIVLFDPSYVPVVVDAEGIHVSLSMKVDLYASFDDVSFPEVCIPTISMSGTYVIDSGVSGVGATWVSGPSSSITLPFGCGTLDPWVEMAIAAQAAERFDASIQTAVADLELPCGTMLTCDFTTTTDEVVLTSPVLASNVVIAVPYNTTSAPTPWSTGLALNPGEPIFIAASGLSTVCKSAGSALPGTCGAAKLGQAGLFNWKSNPPVDSPWVLIGTVYAYYAERAQARAALVGLSRNTAPLPMPTRNAGSLVARLANGPSAAAISAWRPLGEPCQMYARPLVQDRIAFGANDYRSSSGAEYGSGTWFITIIFADFTELAGADILCP